MRVSRASAESLKGGDLRAMRKGSSLGLKGGKKGEDGPWKEGWPEAAQVDRLGAW